MDAVKTILMGCGVLALLSVVGCVGLTSAGYYAIDQAIEEQEARNAVSGFEKNNGRPSQASDPFTEYQAESYYSEDSGEDEGGWGDGTR